MTAARLSILLLLAVMACASAEVTPHPLIGSNAVLQQGGRVPVWGTARDGERVTVTFQGQKQSTVAKGGRWMIHLKKLKPGGPFVMTISGDNFLTLENILVGDVWLCSGQSNMELGLGGAHNAKEELPAANHPSLRLFVVSPATASSPQTSLTPNPSNEVHGHWQICTPETVLKDGTWPAYPGFSAVGYFFGREILEKTGQPVGLIGSYYGGTLVEAWTSPDAFKPQRGFTNADSASRAVNPPKTTPGVLFNAMIHPLIPYAMKGVVWYQGEQNAAAPDGYADVFKGMIKDWRKRWGLGDFPFLFVEIAGYHAPQTSPSEGGWAWVREQQARALTVPKTAMASALDLGAPFDVHPRDKVDVGRRLALAAQCVAYGEKLVYSGPVYDSMKIEGATIRISFRHLGCGLKMGTPPWTASGKPLPPPIRLTGFAIAGADRKWFWADAVIDGNEVLVSSADVGKPVAVRYAWASFPAGNLYNAADLPASSFRTDTWPSQ